MLDGSVGTTAHRFRTWVTASGPVIREVLRYREFALLAIALACVIGLIIIRGRRWREAARGFTRVPQEAGAARRRHAVSGRPAPGKSVQRGQISPALRSCAVVSWVRPSAHPVPAPAAPEIEAWTSPPGAVLRPTAARPATSPRRRPIRRMTPPHGTRRPAPCKHGEPNQGITASERTRQARPGSQPRNRRENRHRCPQVHGQQIATGAGSARAP